MRQKLALLGIAAVIVFLMIIFIPIVADKPPLVKNPFRQIKKEFHVKIKCLTDSPNSGYQILFTEDNWDTETTINNAFDISEPMNQEYVVHQRELVDGEQQAIKFAKQFTSIQICIQYNDSVKLAYDSILAYRKAHPVTAVGTTVTDKCDKNGIIVH